MKDIIINTVGTSLLGNLERSEANGLKQILEKHNAKGLSLGLLGIDPHESVLGAEINSITSIFTSGRLDTPEKLYLLVSDTDQGRFIGDALKHYYLNKRNPNCFNEVIVQVIDGLMDKDVKRFRRDGLRSLVRLIAAVVRKFGADRLLINATGGYKAQISFAGMIGQAMGIPVCYLFERFSEVIELPPQPISLDLGFWLDHATLFFELNAGIVDDKSGIPNDERFEGLVERVKEGREHLTCLSAVGQLMHDSFRLRFARSKKNLLPPDAGLYPNEKTIKYEDKNSGKHPGLAVYLERIIILPYVKRIYTHYYNPDLPKSNLFRKSTTHEFQVEGWFSNAGVTTKFDVLTTASTPEQQAACIADFNDRFAV